MEKTSWKKNLDSRYISGEDLQGGLKGLKPEMTVIIYRFTDSPSFDQKANKDITITALFLKTLDGKDVYKPIILNKTNAKFLSKECGSDFMEDWIGKIVVIFAQPDKRFGFVVRFKPFHKPVLKQGTPEFDKVVLGIANGFTIDQVKAKYEVSKDVELLLIHKK